MEVYRKSELFCSECHTQNTTIQFKTTEKYLLCYPCYSKYGTKHIKARSIQYVCDVCEKIKACFFIGGLLICYPCDGRRQKIQKLLYRNQKQFCIHDQMNCQDKLFDKCFL